MTTIASLRILLGLDSGAVKTGASGVNADLKRVQREANNTNATLRQIGKGVQAGLGLGAGLTAFSLASRGVSELTGFLSDSVKAAIDEEAGIKRLGQALTANVPAFDGNTTAIEATIKAREALAFSDGDLRDSLAALSGATHDVGRALDLQSLAMDLARFKGEDLASATAELVKVQGGSFRALKSLGIALDAGATSSEAFAAIQKVVAGQAAAFGDTTAGAMEAASIAVHNLQEDIGITLAPAIKGIANFVRNDLVPALHDLGEVIGLIPWDKVGAAIGMAFGPIGNAVHGAAELKGTLADLTGETDRNAEALRGQTIVNNMAAQAAAAHGRAVAAGAVDADTARVAALGLTDQQLRVARATVNAGAAHADLSEALKAAQAAGSDNALAMGDLAAAQAADKRATDELTASTNLAAAAFTFEAGQAQALRNILALPGPMLGGDPNDTATNARLNQQNQETIDARDKAQAAADQRAQDRLSEQKRLAAEALSAGKQAAADLARTYHEKLGKAFADTADRAHEAFAKIHSDNLKAIDDARDLANAQLDEQERAIRGAVDGERARIAAMRTHRQELELRAAVSVAANPEDLARAQQALNDFLDDQRLAFLGSQADTQVATLEAEKKTNDAKAAAATELENKRNKDQVAALDRDLANLKEHLEKYTGEWEKAFKDIAAAAKRYGVDDIVGVHPISLATGSKATSAIPASMPASATVAAGLAAPVIEITNIFRVGENELLDIIERHQWNLGGIYNPTPVSTGSQR